MCGLIGAVSGELYHKDLKMVGYLQFFNQLRGTDSTGIAFGYADGSIELNKAVGGFDALRAKLNEDTEEGSAFHGYTYMPEGVEESYTVNGKVKYLIKAKKSLFYMGHGRYKTVGEVDEENAHPFMFDNIVGMHNGTLLDYYYKGLSTYDENYSDSYAVLAKIDSLSSPDVSPEKYSDDILAMLSGIRGAYAIVWWDKHRKEMNFVRNHERTLYIGSSKDSKKVYWASEEWMIEVAAKRAGIPDIESGALPTRTWLTARSDDKGVMDVTRRKALYTYTVVPDTDFCSTLYGYHWNKSDTNTRPKPMYASTFRGVFVPSDEWDKLTSGGCAACGCNLFIEDHMKYSWYDRDTPLCDECAKEFEDELKGVV